MNSSTKCIYFSVFPFQVTDTVRWSSSFAITLNASFAVIATFGNSAVILALLKYKELRTTGNLLIGFLAVTDLLVGCVVQPLCIAFEVLTITESPPSCFIIVSYTVMRVLCTILSQMTVLLISFEKSLAIFWPFQYREWVSKRRAVFIVTFVWILWGLVVSSRFMGISTKTFRITVSVVIIASQILTGLAYVRIERLAAAHIKHIKHQLRSVAKDQTHIPWPAKYLWERKALTTTLSIMACLCICYAPLVGVLLANIVSRFPAVFSHVMFTWADTIVYLNSALNPAIYCMRNREFRRAIASLVKHRVRDGRPSHQQAPTASIVSAIEMSTVVASFNSPVLLRIQSLDAI